MKNTLLLLFLFLSSSISAQENEVLINFRPFDYEHIAANTSLSYYRNVSKILAFGVQANYHTSNIDDYYYTTERFSASIDLMHRLSFVKFRNLRIFSKLGASVTREGQKILSSDNYVSFCGTCYPSFPPEYYNNNWVKSNHLGIYLGIGTDIQLFKNLILGIDYGYRNFRLTDLENNSKKKNQTDLNLNLGFKF